MGLLKLKMFAILASNDNLLWASWMKPGGAITCIYALLFSIHFAHILLSYDARISNGLSEENQDFVQFSQNYITELAILICSISQSLDERLSHVDLVQKFVLVSISQALKL